MLVLLLTVAVHDDVMGYTGQPEGEFTAVGVLAFLQLGDNLDESVLEHIVCYFGVADHEKNVIPKVLEQKTVIISSFCQLI